MRGRSLTRTALLVGVLLVYSLLAFVWLLPMSLHPTTMLADSGDPTHLAYVTCWVAHTLFTNPLGLFDTNSFYPHSKTLTFSDHMLPEAVLVAPVYWLTNNPVLVGNATVFFGLVLSAFGMFWLIRDVTGSASAGFLAGIAYSFHGFALVEVVRPLVLHLAWWPLAFMFLLRFAANGRKAALVACAAFLALEGLSCTYFLVYTALLTPVWIVLAYLGQGKRPSRPDLGLMALVFGACGLALVIFLWPYVGLVRSGSLPRLTSVWGMNLLGHLRPPTLGPLWGSVRFFGTDYFGREFKGYLALALGLAGLVVVFLRRGPSAERALGLIGLVSAAVGVVFSLGTPAHVGSFVIDPAPYKLFLSIPVLGGLRHAPRFNVLVILGLALFVGLGCAALLRTLGRAQLVVVGALAILLPLEHWRPPLYGAPIPTGDSLPAVYSWVRDNTSGPLLELPLYAKRRMHALYLHNSTVHWKPVPIGRTSFSPPGYEYLLWALWSFPDEASLEIAAGMGIKTLVIHPLMLSEPERGRMLTWLDEHPGLEKLRCFSDRLPEKFAVYGLGSECVYRISDAEIWRKKACTPSDEIPRSQWGIYSPLDGDLKPLRDADLGTAWSAKLKPEATAHLRVRFAERETLAAVVIETQEDPVLLPRRFALELLGDNGWHEVVPDEIHARSELVLSQLARARVNRLTLRFVPESAQGFRVKGIEPDRWAFSEIRAFRACRASE
jgi:hypothetical protein